LRNEGRRLLSSIVEAVNIARSSGAKVQIAHFKAIGRKAWHDLPKALAILRKAREDEHLDIEVDFFPYLRTGSLLYTLLPEWILEGGKERILETLSDLSKRASVIESLERLTLHFDNITVAETRRDKHSIGKTIASIARSANLSPEETFVQLLVANELYVTIFGKTLASRSLVAIAKEPYSMFGSDGLGYDKKMSLGKQQDLTHPRSYGAAPRFLDRLSKRNQILPWEETVKKMTLMPATRLGIESTRGLLKKGFFADVVIFDPQTLKDMATYSDPYQTPRGIEYVFVNGRLAIEKENYTGALAGKILRRG
jgi:N-acyl-D-amino-acid deacylase